MQDSAGGEPRLLYVRKNLFDALRHLQTLDDVDRRETEFDKTRLHIAAEDGDADAVRALLGAGASCGARDCFGETPLHYAAENGRYDIVKTLVAAGADAGVYDNTGRLPVHCCTQRRRGEWEVVVRFLRDADFRGRELRDFHAGALELETPGAYEKTKLVQAAEDGDLSLVKDLVRRGANLAASDCFGETALHYAAENGHYGVVVELVRAGANMKIVDGSGRTPLDCSTQQERGEWEKVARFLKDAQFRHDELERLARADIEAANSDSSDGKGSGLVWIDAICINQADLDERSAQVRLMPQVYSNASCVIVWFGQTQDIESRITNTYGSVKEIMRQINKTKKLKKLEREWLVSLRAFVVDEIVDWDVPEGGNLTIADIKLILGFFMRSWFSRAWVIQELSLARRIRMFLDGEEFEWHDILKFLCLLAHVGFFRSSSLWKMDAGWRMEDGKGGDGSEAWRLAEIRLRTANDADEWAVIDPIMHMKNCKTPHVRRADKLALPLMLAATWSFESKDPRDKIYAILSLAAPLPPEDEIVIDYTSPVEDLYTQVAHIFLRGSGRDSMYLRDDGLAGILEPLEGFSYVQDPYFSSGQRGKMPELPTWVPDFSNPLATDRIWRRAFRAAKTFEPRFGPGETKGMLHTLGFKLDVVEAVESEWAELEPGDMPPDLEVDVESWFSLLGHVRTENGERPVQVLFRTLSMDQLWRDCDEDARDRYVASFREFLAWELGRTLEQGSEDEDETGSDSESSGTSSADEDTDSDEDSLSFSQQGDTLPSSATTDIETAAEPARVPSGVSRSRLSAVLGVKYNESVQSLSAHTRGRKSVDRLRSWFGKEEAPSPSSQIADTAQPLRDGAPSNGPELWVEGDNKQTPYAAPSLKPSLIDLLERQRALDGTMDTTGDHQQRRFLPSNDEIPSREALAVEWCKFHGPSCEGLDDEASFRYQMARIYRKRCLFRTRDGRLGLGPQAVKPGDVVCLVAGSRTPYLLRKLAQEGEQVGEERCRFLGEAYVHGVMYGEAVVGLAQADFSTVHME